VELDLDEIIKNIDKIANEDGILTNEEEAFISKLKINVEAFQKSLTEVLADSIITDDEFDELVIMRDRILGDAIEFNSGSEDVKRLCKELYNQLDHYTIPGMLDEESDHE